MPEIDGLEIQDSSRLYKDLEPGKSVEGATWEGGGAEAEINDSFARYVPPVPPRTLARRWGRRSGLKRFTRSAECDHRDGACHASSRSDPVGGSVREAPTTWRACRARPTTSSRSMELGAQAAADTTSSVPCSWCANPTGASRGAARRGHLTADVIAAALESVALDGPDLQHGPQSGQNAILGIDGLAFSGARPEWVGEPHRWGVAALDHPHRRRPGAGLLVTARRPPTTG